MDLGRQNNYNLVASYGLRVKSDKKLDGKKRKLI